MAVANTPAGATASVSLYGLIETAKVNRVEPYRHLAHLFSEQLLNVRELVTCGGDVSRGQVDPVECAATACDKHDCLAMLVKGDDKTLGQLLERLDAAIEDGECTDEINRPG